MTGPDNVLERLDIEGFASIVDVSVEIGAINVLVGANGAGKSNLIRALELLGRIVDEDLRVHVARSGGASALLNAASSARRMRLSLSGRSGERRTGYVAELVPGPDEGLFFIDERISYQKPPYEKPWTVTIDRGHRETKLHATITEQGRGQATASSVVDLLRGRAATSLAPGVLPGRAVGEEHHRRPSRLDGRPWHHGGVASWAKLVGDVRRLLGDSSLHFPTTLIDYYGFPADAPGMVDRPSTHALNRVRHVEAAVRAAVGDDRFVPHLVLHELEAWVFAAARQLADLRGEPGLAGELRRQVDDAGGPESVNDGADTAPSKRLLRHCPDYVKTLDGPLAIESLGVPALRRCCPHVDEWLARLGVPGDG